MKKKKYFSFMYQDCILPSLTLLIFISSGMDWMRRFTTDPMARRIAELDSTVVKSVDCLPSATRDSFSISESGSGSGRWTQKLLYEQNNSDSETSLTSSSLPSTGGTFSFSKCP